MWKTFVKKYETKHFVCAILGICIALVCTTWLVNYRMNEVRAKVSETQHKLAKEVLRFHVLANSDSDKDQQVKLAVRDAVIGFMKESMDREFSGEITVDDTKRWADEHRKDLEETAEKVLKEQGFTYGAKAQIQTCHFPDKTYGDVTFPAGNYEALRIQLGEAKGQNWWCVLYPNLCFIDAVNVKVSDEGKQDLQQVLTEDEYEMVTATSKFKVKWFFSGEAGEEDR